jgi:hypothetical protein
VLNGNAVIDPHSETWQAVRAAINEAINANRRICETSGIPMAETENARGALDVLKGLLKLGGEGASQAPRNE